MTNKDVLVLLNSTLSVGKFHKPFTNMEVVKIIDKLKLNNYELKDLYGLDGDLIYKVFFDDSPKDVKRIQFVERMQLLLMREGSIAFDLMEIKKWGIDIITIFDKKYPKVFLDYLGKKAPPLLYYCGNLDLLEKSYIGFSGSRIKQLKKGDEEITRLWAKNIVNNGLGIVSGGATGVDTFAVQEAIYNKSMFIEFLSDSMIKRLKISQISSALQRGFGLLLSEASPYASFNVGMAMARNKYIYLLAKKVIVIKADYTIKNNKKSGGTWNGAVENLNSNYRKTYVLSDNKSKGNMELIEMGGIPITVPEDITSYNHIFLDDIVTHSRTEIKKQIEYKMIEILKNPLTFTKVKLTMKQLEQSSAIKDAILKVNNRFSEFLIDKKIYDKFYNYCYLEATAKSIEQLSIFD